MAQRSAPSVSLNSEYSQPARLSKNQKKKRKKAASRAAAAAAEANQADAAAVADTAADADAAEADIDTAVKESTRKPAAPILPAQPTFAPPVPPLTLDHDLMNRIAKHAHSVTVKSLVNNTFQIQLPHGESSGSDEEPEETSVPEGPHKFVYPNVETVVSTTSVINFGGVINHSRGSIDVPISTHTSLSISSEDGNTEDIASEGVSSKGVANEGLDSDEAEQEEPVVLAPLPPGASLEERVARMERQMALDKAEAAKDAAKARRQTQAVQRNYQQLLKESERAKATHRQASLKLEQAQKECDRARKENANIKKMYDNAKREWQQARRQLREAVDHIQALTTEIIELRNTNEEHAACFVEVYGKLSDLYVRDTAHAERIRYVERWAVSLLHYAESLQTPEICAIQFRVFLDSAQYLLAKAAGLKCDEINGPDVWSASLGLGGHDGRGFVKIWATLPQEERDRINKCRLQAAKKVLRPALNAGNSALLPIMQSAICMKILTEFQSSIRLKGNAAAHTKNLFPGVDETEMIELIRSKDSGLLADERQAMEAIFLFVYFPSDGQKNAGA